jgi:hypothetical protein
MYPQAKVLMKALTHIVFVALLINAGTALAQTDKPVVIPRDSTTSIKNPAFTKDTGIQVVKVTQLRPSLLMTLKRLHYVP